MSERFQVDLTGMVDLLSRHLYSGPQVFLRELIQNAADAITARSELDAAAPARIRIGAETDVDGRSVLTVVDTGIGLTSEEAAELLATIGRSSKRDPALELGRSEFIGQFGIGLLAAFMVADRVEVRSRSAKPGALPILWEGRADGTFDVSSGSDTETPVGTAVRIVARPDAAHWVSGDTVLGLAHEYASLLPFDISVEVPLEVPADERGVTPQKVRRRITLPELPWRETHPSRSSRERALAAYCEETFGFTPLGHIDLELPVAGVSGVAFILPQAVAPGSGQHRVYTKRMLLGPRVDRVLPEWAFFTRAVIDAGTLTPTASREQLHDDELLMGVREALGTQVKAWVLDTLRTPGALTRAVLTTHHLALRALAVTDPEMLELVAEVLPYETSDGAMTLAAVAERGDVVYTPTTEAYRRVSAVARAQGLIVVNAGYVYDADLLQQLGRLEGWSVRELRNSDLVQTLGLPSLEREMELSEAVSGARDLLTEEDCDVIVRTFAPDTVPAVLLRDAEGEHRRDLDRERTASPDLWGGLLDSFADERVRRSRTLVLNDESSVARRLLAAPRSRVFPAGLRSLYLSAVMLAGEGLRSAESAALTDALGVLLDASLDATAQEDTQ